MSDKQRIRQLEAELRSARANEQFWKRCAERAEKRDALLREGITFVHPRDKAFMMQRNAGEQDSDLLDVFNSLLYSFGRPINAEGLVYTRLSCPG